MSSTRYLSSTQKHPILPCNDVMKRTSRHFSTLEVLLPHSFLIGEQERFLNPISYWEHMGNTVLCVAEFLFVRPNLPWQLVACPVRASGFRFFQGRVTGISHSAGKRPRARADSVVKTY